MAGADQKLRGLLTASLQAVADNLRSLINRTVVLQLGEILLLDGPAVIERLKGNNAIVRGALDKDYAGKTLCVLVDATDATTLAGAMMMTPEHTIEARRKTGTLEGEELEAFGEVGNVLCSGMDSILRQHVKNCGVRLQDHSVVKPGLDTSGVMPKEPQAVCVVNLKIGDFPATESLLLIDQVTAQAWNDKPLVAPAAPETRQSAPANADSVSGGTKPGSDESDEDIPKAPIRGKLAAFVWDADSWVAVRKSCRRIGLELDRRSKNDIPNPAVHKDQVVVIEVGVGEERKFDWCKRLKQYNNSIKVVLLLHHPTKPRVLQGFMAQADVILGPPLTEPPLTNKLAALLPPTPAVPATS